ncbi:MAG TPA: coproporphyrinogen III oxidase, partial [Steroidobacteraceae bacterium]|nr:coproporphyrinogen III oxidase [Steroidobacteraceae bacterium]
MSGADAFAGTAVAYFRDLQGRLCTAFEAFEPAARFAARPWNKPTGHRLQGGGESRLMRGAVFEKVGVNVSHVWGVLANEARGQVAGAEASDGRFVAAGISLVAHMANPYVPAMHMNLRYLCTSRAWFGGGADLTPTFPFEEDTAAFHGALRAACDGYRA